MHISKQPFGRLSDGSAVDLYHVDTENGLSVSLISYGGLLTSVQSADKTGNMGEITLSHDTIEPFEAGHPFFGAFVGRIANRISGGGFTLDGVRYPLFTKEDGIHLHGGKRGFDKYLYDIEVEEKEREVLLHCTRLSPAGEEGYPGALKVRYTVGVRDDNTLFFEYRARTDAPTVFNPTNHTYWNLGGAKIVDHLITLHSDRVVEVDRSFIPTGRLLDVADGPFDFRAPKAVCEDFGSVLSTGANGYDHSFAINGWSGEEWKLRKAAHVYSPESGREMTVSTSFPDVHFYTGNNLIGGKGRGGVPLSGQEALCLECQFFADSPNRPEFPSVVLRPGEEYYHRTEHAFSHK